MKVLTLIALIPFMVFSAPQNSKSYEHYVESSLLSNIKKLGEGDMSFLFWDLYKAEFFAGNKIYQPTHYPQALKLTYKRNIEKADFIEATQDQWSKLRKKHKSVAISAALEKSWLKKLSNIFPNISDKDTILLVVDENKKSHFYFKPNGSSISIDKNINYTKIGLIEDNAFGAYFLSIWLSEHTSEPKLRQKLIGKK